MTLFDRYPKYKRNARDRQRMNLRHRFCVDAMKPYFEGKRVLDLASHDGRWAFCYAEAGAKRVVGVEGRQDLIDAFGEFPNPRIKARVELYPGDAADFMLGLTAVGERYDFVAILGFYYHTMEHYRLLALARDLGAQTICIDSEFVISDNAMIQVVMETTDKASNAIATLGAQNMAVIGIPSLRATEQMADVLGYDVTWLDWDSVPEDERVNVGDYYRKGRKRRMTCRLDLRPDTCVAPLKSPVDD